MAYVVPNSFTTNTTIESDKVQENIDSIRNYLNGNVAASDISTASQWAAPKHVMKGLYNPINNRYEMQSGLVGGTVELTSILKLMQKCCFTSRSHRDHSHQKIQVHQPSH